MSKKRNIFMFSFPLLIILSCSNPYEDFEISEDFILEPGNIYKANFYSSVDSFPSGKIFQSSKELMSSPLSRMYRKPVIIKADDLRASVTKNWRRFIYWAEYKAYNISLGLICNSLAYASEKDINFLKELNKWKNEIWLHGWDHEVNPQTAEFQGKSLNDQKLHLKTSVMWAKKKLDLDLKTFGSPGNRTDEFTALAVKSHPELEVWFHSNDFTEKPYLIPVNWVAELKTGILRELNDFIEEVKKINNDDIIVLQIHPSLWNEKDLELFGEMVEYTLNFMERRFVTPYGQFTWSQDKFNLKVQKIDNNQYYIDCSSMVYAHRLDVDFELLSFEKINLDSLKVLDG